MNVTAIKISSDGAWQGESPLNYTLPLLVIQTTLVLLLSRIVAFFLKPLRQPKVVAEIVVCSRFSRHVYFRTNMRMVLLRVIVTMPSSNLLKVGTQAHKLLKWAPVLLVTGSCFLSIVSHLSNSYQALEHTSIYVHN